ncbi:MAG: pirin family protein [Kofleriaceae bacterium]|nr:pirin family protein [Kofleriaceae bacterium]
MPSPNVLAVVKLGFPWPTLDPFLFCVHHDDAYPAGNADLGPAASLAGRDLGQDFAGKDGWRMYHGTVVPGFPQHPHRGFETVTVARRGFIDHSDSLGATARFGRGDCQWMTAGRGIVHCEMFPLLDPDGPNPVELFQIWLNLPAADKLTEPHFTMLWADGTPVHALTDVDGRAVTVTTYAGPLPGAAGQAGQALPPPAPPPKSWAARPEHDVAIWTVRLAAGARWTVPAARPGSQRVLYFFAGDHLDVDGQRVPRGHAIQVRADVDLPLVAGGAGELLLLQGQPIGEPVVQHGPFVMNTPTEIQQAFADYRRTQFGGWPWPSDAPTHSRDAGRFARHVDGRVEHAT